VRALPERHNTQPWSLSAVNVALVWVCVISRARKVRWQLHMENQKDQIVPGRGGVIPLAAGCRLVGADGCSLQAGGALCTTVYHGRWPLPLPLPGTPAVGRCGGMAWL